MNKVKQLILLTELEKHVAAARSKSAQETYRLQKRLDEIRREKAELFADAHVKQSFEEQVEMLQGWDALP